MKSYFRRWLGFAILLVLGLALVACSGGAQPAAAGQSTSAAEPTIPPVIADTSVMAEGKVVPVQEAALSFPANGVVGEVLVSEGAKVQANQPLMRQVGNEQLESVVAAAELELLTAQQALEDLKNAADLERAQAQLAVAEAKKELDKAEKRLYSKEYQRGDEEQVAIARANYVVAEDAITDATEFYNRFDERAEEDKDRAEAFALLAGARQRRDVALANLNYLLSKPNEMDVAQIDAQLAVAKAKMAEAELALSRVKDGPNANAMALAEARLKNTQIALVAAQASLEDLELRAPFAGTISSLETVMGEFVGPGTAVIHLVDFSTWMVETTDLTELNIARIQPGMPATIRFDALPGVELIGRVDRIKAFGENRQGDVVYTVLLKLDKPDERLRWNMTASITFLEKDE